MPPLSQLGPERFQKLKETNSIAAYGSENERSVGHCIIHIDIVTFVPDKTHRGIFFTISH